MTDQSPDTTTNAGAPAGSDEYSLTAGPAGPNQKKKIPVLPAAG